MQFLMKTSSVVPAGTYSGEFVRAEPYRDNLEKYGEGVLLVWKITEGEHQGEEASRIVSAKLNARTNLYRFVVALKGGPIEPGQNVELDTYIGTRGVVIVEETDSGSTRVTTFLRQG